MRFEPSREIDKGPIVRWIANRILDATNGITRWAYQYADMYTAVWDEDEDEDVVDEDQIVAF